MPCTPRAALRVAAAAVAFSAMLGAAPAQAGSDYLLALGGVDGGTSGDKHKNEIEILSFKWGETRAAGKVDYGWKVEEGESAPPPPGTGNLAAKRGTPAPQGEKGGTENMYIGVGELQSAAPAAGGVRVASGDIDGDGRAASGQATGKRQHKPLRMRPYIDTSASAGGGGDFTRDGKASGMTPSYNPKELTVDKDVPWNSHTRKQPLPRGSLIVRGKFPACAVGTRYPTLTLGGKGQRYVLHDAVVTSCARAPGEALPMEEVSFNYSKIN